MLGLDLVLVGTGQLAVEAPKGDILALVGFDYTPALAEALASPLPRCRWVQLFFSGYDRVAGLPLPPKVTFSRAAGPLSQPTAGHAMALLLSITRRISAAIDAMKRREWDTGIWHTLDTLVDRNLLILERGISVPKWPGARRLSGCRLPVCLRATGLNVTDPEPLPPESDLRDAPNVQVTPHIGGAAAPDLLRLSGEFLCGQRRGIPSRHADHGSDRFSASFTGPMT